jgi:WD40 repeat protein
LLIEQILITEGRLVYFDRTAGGFYARLWDYQTEPETLNFTYAGDIRLRAVTPDGRYLILALDDGLLEVVDVLTHQRKTAFAKHKTRVYEVAVAPDGQTVLSLSRDGIGFMWDVQTATQKLSCELPDQFDIRAITPDSRRALLAAPGRPIIEIPLERAERMEIRGLDGHTKAVHDVAVTADGRLALSASEDCTVKLWSLQSGEQLASAALDHPAQRVAFAGHGELMVAGDAAGNVYCLRYATPDEHEEA